MSKLTLTKENTSKIISAWKTQVQNHLQSIALPKKFLGTSVTSPANSPSSSSTSSTDFHPVDSLYDFILKCIPPPQSAAYGNNEDFRENLQKYKQSVAMVKVAMKDFLSDDLYELFISEEHCNEGWSSVMLEIKYDEASQLKVLERELELIAQFDTQTVKEYTDAVNHLVLKLQGLGVNTNEQGFQQRLSARFLLGMRPAEAKRLRIAFQQKGIVSFKAMRAEINEEAANEELSKAQRSHVVSQDNQIPSALTISDQLEAQILKIVEKAMANVPVATTKDEAKVFVKALNPRTTQEQLESAFKTFGQVVSVDLFRNPNGTLKNCGVIEFKDEFAAEAAKRQSRNIIVCGKQIVVEPMRRRGINPRSGIYLSALVDSGCSPNHLTPKSDILKNISSSQPFSLSVADGRTMMTSGIKGDFTTSGLDVKDVEVVPGLSKILLSAFAFLKDKKDVWFKWEDMSVNIGHLDQTAKHEVLAKGSAKGGLFELKVEPTSSTFIATGMKKTWDLWHKRCMHYGYPTLKNTLDSGAVRGMDVIGSLPPNLHCHDCIQGKMHRLPHPPSRFGVENLKGGKLSRIAVDILHMPVPSMNGAQYVVGVTVVSANGFKICYPCRHKSEMASKLRFMKKYLENLTGEKVSEIVADKAGENISKEVTEICLDAGIVLSKTGTEEHQSNGQIENWWRVALDCWRSHHLATGCQMNLWADGLCYMAYIFNRLVHEGHSKTPYEALTGQVPTVHDLRVFGCLAYAHVLPKNRLHGKLSPRAIPGIFIGLEYYDAHPLQQKGGYKILTDMDNPRSIICSRDVVFIEDEFCIPPLSTPSSHV